MNDKEISADDEVIQIYNSKLKYGFLASLSFIAATVAAHMAINLTAFSMGETIVQYGVSGVAIIIGLVLLNVGYSKQPILIIDQEGVTCSRPDTGLIPWEAIAGLGITRASLVRAALLIAIEPEKASEEQQIRWSKHISSGFLNRSVSGFQRRIQSKLTIQIPISFLAISGRKLREEIARKVHRNNGDDALI